MNVTHTIAGSAVVIAEKVAVVVNTIVRSLAMRARIHLLSDLGALPALAMVFVEFIRGAHGMWKHRHQRGWKRWATGLVIAVPCFVAMLYYGVHGIVA
jgi:hypothetical protein